MPEQITQQQLQLMTDIIGGLAGQSVSVLLQTPSQAQSPIKSSPYTLYKAHKPVGPRAEGAHAMKVKPPKPPKPQYPTLAASAQKPSHVLDATPPQATQAPQVQAPQDQQVILEQVKREAQQYTNKPDYGTNLAHWLRTHYTNRSVTSQFEAAGVADLDTLAQILNKQQEPQNAVNLDVFHDDQSPFTILSEPRQDFTTGGIPAVVVGQPYVGQVHQLEEAFPGVHFMAVDEAPKELEEAAAALAKPLPAKSLRPSPYRKYFTKDEESPKPPKNPPKAPSASQSAPQPPAPQPKPDAASQPQSRQAKPTSRTQPMPPPNSRLARTEPYTPPPEQPHEAMTEAATRNGFDPESFLHQAVGQLRGEWQKISPDQYRSVEEWAGIVARQVGELALARGYSPRQMEEASKLAYEQALQHAEEWSLPPEAQQQEEVGETTEFEPSTTETGKVLQTAKTVKMKEKRSGGKSKAFIMELEGGTKGFFKPADGEDPAFRDKPDPNDPTKIIKSEIPTGTFYLREIAASDIARFLGMGHLIPETVLRDEAGRVGSIQAFQDNLVEAIMFYDGSRKVVSSRAYGRNPEHLAQAATLDYLFGNTDRHLANWGVNSQTGDLVLFDHGICFPEGTQRMARFTSTTYGYLLRRATKSGARVPDLSTFKDQWATIEKMLRRTVDPKGKRIGEKAIALTKERFETLVKYSGQLFQDVPDMNMDEQFRLKDFFIEGNRIPNDA